MRFVISIVAALMIMGLAAFGIVLAQKMSTARSQATASDSPATPAPEAAPTAARRHPVNPVSLVAETGAEAAPAASAPAAPAPMPMAQAIPTTPAATPSAAAPQPKPAPSATAIPACDKPGGMGLARIVEIDTTGYAITYFARAVGAARSGNPNAAKADIAHLVELRDRLKEAKDAYWSNIVDIQQQVFPGPYAVAASQARYVFERGEWKAAAELQVSTPCRLMR